MNFDLKTKILNPYIRFLITSNIELAEQGAGWIKKINTFILPWFTLHFFYF
jgi:hypothetical protein